MVDRNKFIIYTISFLDLFAIGLIVPIFQNHLKSLGASHSIIGLIGSTYSGIQIISGPVIGSWSDVTDRKLVLITTLVASCICYMALGFVSSITAVFLIRIVLGCVKHTQGLCRAMVLDLFPSKEHSELLSRSTALGTIGFIVGPLLGGYLSELVNGFTYVCCLTAFLFILNAGLSAILPNFGSSGIRKRNNWRIKEEFLKIGSNIKEVNWKENWRAFSVRFLFGISIAFYYNYETTYLKEKYDLTQKYIGFMMSLQGILQTLSAFSLGYIKNVFYKNEISCEKRLFHFFTIMSFSLFSIWLFDNLTFFITFAVFFRISSSILRITTMELLLENCEREKIGTFTGVSSSVMSVTRFIAPVTSGIACDILSEKSPFILAFVPSFLGSFLVHKIIKNDEKTLKKD